MRPEFGEMVQALRIPLEMNAKAGDNVVILTDTGIDEALPKAMFAAAIELGMEPVTMLMTPRPYHACDPVSPIMYAATDPSVDIYVFLTSTALAHAPIANSLYDLGKRFLLLEELTPEMLAPGGPARADYAAMSTLGALVASVLGEGKHIRVQCPNGTDLTASIEGRPGRNVTGRVVPMRANGAGGCAFPDGEAHVCPVEGTGEGTIVFDLTAHNVGTIHEPMRLTVEKGMVTKIEGGREAEIWRKVFADAHDPNSYNAPAEIAVGLNPNVTPTGVMRTDKKMYGASHIGVGDTVVLGGTCHAKLRLEGVIREPVISVDGREITRGGRILVG